MTLELVPDLCEVCDIDGDLDTFHGLSMHTDCAPGPWRDDREAQTEFHNRIERKRNRRKQ